jgi:hypothetical protein
MEKRSVVQDAYFLTLRFVLNNSLNPFSFIADRSLLFQSYSYWYDTVSENEVLIRFSSYTEKYF